MTKKVKNKKIDNYILQTVDQKNPQTIADLIETINQETDTPKSEIMERVLKLNEEKKLNFGREFAQPPADLLGYISAPASRWYWITIFFTIIATATAILVPEDAYPFVYLRYALGIPMALFFPGYVITKLLFGDKEIKQLTRQTLNIAISMLIVPIIGLLLNYTYMGIGTSTVSISVLTFVIIMATLALIREYQKILETS